MFISCLMFAFIVVMLTTYTFTAQTWIVRCSIILGAAIGLLFGWFTRNRTIPGLLSAIVAVAFYLAAILLYFIGSMTDTGTVSILFLSATPIPMAAGTLALLMHRSTYEELKEIVDKKTESDCSQDESE